jgi:hypothetical protein
VGGGWSLRLPVSANPSDSFLTSSFSASSYDTASRRRRTVRSDVGGVPDGADPNPGGAAVLPSSAWAERRTAASSTQRRAGIALLIIAALFVISGLRPYRLQIAALADLYAQPAAYPPPHARHGQPHSPLLPFNAGWRRKGRAR